MYLDKGPAGLDHSLLQDERYENGTEDPGLWECSGVVI